MNKAEIEDLYIRSLDVPLSKQESEVLSKELAEDAELREQLLRYNTLRETLRSKIPATYGPYFASKLINKIQDTSVVIDHFIFSFFKRFQLAAVGLVVALFVLNVMLSDQSDLRSILGLNATIPSDEETLSFDFFQTINESL